jgi:hypothetical protein
VVRIGSRSAVRSAVVAVSGGVGQPLSGAGFHRFSIVSNCLSWLCVRQVCTLGAVCPPGVDRWSAKTPFLRENALPLYRLYCAFTLKLGAYGQILKAHRSYCAHVLRLYTPTTANFWASAHAHALPRRYCALTQNLGYTRHYTAIHVYRRVVAHILAVSKVTIYRRLLPSS